MAYDKQAFNLQKFIISIVIVSVTLIIGIYVSDVLGQTLDAPNTAASVSNETGAWINATTYTVDSSTARDFAGLSVTRLVNTSNFEIALANITVSGSGFTNASAQTWQNVLVTYGYTFTAETNASNAAQAVVLALATGTSWISILVVVGFAVIVLTMLTSGLSASARNEAATPYY